MTAAQKDEMTEIVQEEFLDAGIEVKRPHRRQPLPWPPRRVRRGAQPAVQETTEAGGARG